MNRAGPRHEHIIMSESIGGADGTVLHALVFVVWIPAVAIWLLLDRRRGRGRLLDATLLHVVAWATLLAALIHLAVTPEHFAEAALYGAFFAVVTAAQLGYAVAVVARPGRFLLAAGAVAQLLIVGLWAWTRTVGIPLGPSSGEVEAAGALDVICAVAEIAAAVAGLWLVRRSRRGARQHLRRDDRPAEEVALPGVAEHVGEHYAAQR